MRGVLHYSAMRPAHTKKATRTIGYWSSISRECCEMLKWQTCEWKDTHDTKQPPSMIQHVLLPTIDAMRRNATHGQYVSRILSCLSFNIRDATINENFRLSFSSFA